MNGSPRVVNAHLLMSGLKYETLLTVAIIESLEPGNRAEAGERPITAVFRTLSYAFAKLGVSWCKILLSFRLCRDTRRTFCHSKSATVP